RAGRGGRRWPFRLGTRPKAGAAWGRALVPSRRRRAVGGWEVGAGLAGRTRAGLRAAGGPPRLPQGRRGARSGERLPARDASRAAFIIMNMTLRPRFS